MVRAKRVEAVAHLRTSSAANVGTDKDSEHRQRAAIEAFARSGGFHVVDWYYDAAVSGADPVEARPGFSALLDRIEGNGVRTVLVEDASRLAREMLVMELAIVALVDRGVTVLAANGDNLTETSDPFRVAMRQVAAAFAQLEKARLVHKLRAARERKRAAGVKVEGRKSHAEVRPEAVALARRLHRASPKTGRRMSLRAIAAELAEAGHRNANGRPFSAQSVANMVV